MSSSRAAAESVFETMSHDFDDEFDDDAPSHTSVTMKLAVIQQRCKDLLKDTQGELGGLSLADDEQVPGKKAPNPYDPYDRG